jgi:hypothetical protein
MNKESLIMHKCRFQPNAQPKISINKRLQKNKESLIMHKCRLKYIIAILININHSHLTTSNSNMEAGKTINLLSHLRLIGNLKKLLKIFDSLRAVLEMKIFAIQDVAFS